MRSYGDERSRLAQMRWSEVLRGILRPFLAQGWPIALNSLPLGDDPMKITSVRATWVHVPIPEAQQHLSDFGRISSFDATIVRIETACGLVG